MKNYDEMLKNQVIVSHEFNPLVASLTPDAFNLSLADNSTIISPDIDELWREINNLKRRTPAFVELSCKNCGAKIQQKYEDQIIKCPYCKTAYIIGTWRVNET